MKPITCIREVTEENVDIRSGEHLIDPIPHVESYSTDEKLVDVLMSNRDILKTFLSTLGCSLSNYQLRETSNNATRWVNDLNHCETIGGLTEDMKLWRKGNKALLQFVYNHRLARCQYSAECYRRQ
jgi:hypothetical protein